MLRSLRLRDYVIVAEATIPFGPGFSVLTGETGAGKSILIDALGLALGDRGDARMVREGADRADICAEFASTDVLDRRLAGLDLAGDPGTLLLRRVVEADGRSRALVNGHPTTVAQMREIGAALVDIHGQHESQRLLSATAQRQLVDRHGRLDKQVTGVGEAFAAWQACERTLEAARSGSRERELKLERLTAEIDEIETLRLDEGEWTSLSDEQSRLAHARELIEGAGQAADSLARGDASLSDSLRAVQATLRPLATIDPALGGALEMLDSAQIQIDEAASTLASYAERVDLDPQRLAEVEARVAAIHGTARRLRIPPEALLAHLEEAQAELDAIGGTGDVIELEARAAGLKARYDELAAALSAARRKVATRFGNEVSKLLDRLAMPKARLIVQLTEAPPSASGIDAVEFAIAAHAGGTPRPIARFASGGELSRIGLAIATLSAADQPVSVLIFDEADAGIGGTVANVIGELMQRLGSDRQVLCVTHLPQVASRADHHLLVTKDTADEAAGEVAGAGGEGAAALGTAAKDAAGKKTAAKGAAAKGGAAKGDSAKGDSAKGATGRGATAQAGAAPEDTAPRGRIEVLTADERVDEIARMLGAGKASKAHAREMLAVSAR